MRGGEVLLVVVGLVTLAACAERRTAVVDCGKYVGSPSEYYGQIASPAGALNDQDRQFICRAAVSEVAGIVFARMGKQRAASPAIRDYAQKMADDHQQAYFQLESLARGQTGIAAPVGLDAAHLGTRDQLAAVSGTAFDQAYLRAAIAEDRSSIQIFQHEMAEGGDPTLRRYAANTLPLLQQRLLAAQGIGPQLP
jgi:putative membrane protein